MNAHLPLSIQLSWLIPLYGFSGVLLSLPWATGWVKRNGPRPAAYLNLLMTVLGVAHGSLILAWVQQNGGVVIEWPWFETSGLDLRIGFDLSLTNLAALEFVTIMSLLGQVFALGYLDKEWSLARFYALLGFFEGAMAGVVLSSNLFLSYFVLEMLTLSTYLLVGFWYAQPLVVTAARDAFLTKRVGDVLLLMSVVALAAWAGSLDFEDLYAWAAQVKADGSVSPLLGTLIGLGLIAGPMGKCAQFPMHLWLDEAMEGPNPASILRNSAVVTCGALVLLKVMPLLQLSPVAIDVLLIVGTISAIGGALVAIAQVDIKRAFSYGTTSYLGLVFVAIAVQQPIVAVLLLFAHGLAKALIFMSVGSVIATTNCQDITELGGLGPRMPATTGSYLIAGAGLTGVLPLGCFWCFGLLVDGLWPNYPWLVPVVLLTNALTAFNLVRVFRQVFLDKPHPKTKRTPEVNWLMALPMVSLAVVVLLVPLIFHRIYPIAGVEVVTMVSMVAVVVSSLVGVASAAAISLDKFGSRSVFKPLRTLQDLLAYDFYTERFYRSTVVAFVAFLARITDAFDRLLLNRFVNRIGSSSMVSAEGLRLAVSGQTQSYVLTVLLAIVLLLSALVWWRAA
ncbi:NADH dehydrogenase I subunit NdhF (chain 5 or L) [Synechococcus sp. Minos11]|uniref:NAD(P)H-quinone oxidoreductase subunit F n=1 Tax=Synechococcus sp. Minos11 TaxID=221341 RepID=UPI0001525800|nr:NAD(P)H-quinone oxidoreductase subunit F [Synechococcus sp. Minos11]MEC8608443.1 NAD(P)H-quinone oxidoreductase subunit F [Cyanobacteriota bacterium]NBQ36630.1 NAD(P)H-quinone oxidoreductase subunit F [Synechococcus sp.]RCL62566.1 MAG: NAD(P)H-quinone oxidoreductase subunit F [Synechococcus sp. MED-G67]CAK27730.1 NAD(P)H-quinone oxidoreductase chain 5 [Synechococcus sp. RCC307]QNJ08373.1 NADH dehydrogenase I subunit NdhF (chain 5 or L) [Synechococcus sp. Minos11]